MQAPGFAARHEKCLSNPLRGLVKTAYAKKCKRLKHKH